MEAGREAFMWAARKSCHYAERVPLSAKELDALRTRLCALDDRRLVDTVVRAITGEMHEVYLTEREEFAIRAGWAVPRRFVELIDKLQRLDRTLRRTERRPANPGEGRIATSAPGSFPPCDLDEFESRGVATLLAALYERRGIPAGDSGTAEAPRYMEPEEHKRLPDGLDGRLAHGDWRAIRNLERHGHVLWSVIFDRLSKASGESADDPGEGADVGGLEEFLSRLDQEDLGELEWWKLRRGHPVLEPLWEIWKARNRLLTRTRTNPRRQPDAIRAAMQEAAAAHTAKTGQTLEALAAVALTSKPGRPSAGQKAAQTTLRRLLHPVYEDDYNHEVMADLLGSNRTQLWRLMTKPDS